jgi:hypothetical protein
MIRAFVALALLFAASPLRADVDTVARGMATRARLTTETKTTIFDQAFCSTVGYFIVRTTGAWVCNPSIPLDPVWFGADPSGVSSSDAAVVSALSTAGYIRFRPGTYKFTAPITYTIPASGGVRIEGAGSGQTKLSFASTQNGIVLHHTDKFAQSTVSGLAITAEGAGGATCGLSLILDTTTTPSPGVTNFSTVSYNTFRGSDGFGASNYWGTSLCITRLSDINIISNYFIGGTGRAGTGVSIVGSSTSIGVVYNFLSDIFQVQEYGIVIGTDIQGVNILQTNLTNMGTAIYAPSGGTNLSQIVVMDSQIQSFGTGINIQSNAQPVKISNNLIFTTVGQKSIVSVGTGIFDVTGNEFWPFGGAPTTAIEIGAPSGGSQSTGYIAGNKFVTGYVTDIDLLVGSTNVVVAENSFASTGAIRVADAGTNNYVVPLTQHGSCTMTAGACAAQTFPYAYKAGAPPCQLTWTGTGALAGVLKVASSTTTVTPTSSNAADTAVVNWVCSGAP